MFLILNGISFVISLIADILNQILVWIISIPAIMVKFILGHFPAVASFLPVLAGFGIIAGVIIVIKKIIGTILNRKSIGYDYMLHEDLMIYDNLRGRRGGYDQFMAVQNIGDGKLHYGNRNRGYYNVEPILRYHTPLHPFSTFLYTKSRPEFRFKPFFGLLGFTMSVAYITRFGVYLALASDVVITFILLLNK